MAAEYGMINTGIHTVFRSPEMHIIFILNLKEGTLFYNLCTYLLIKAVGVLYIPSKTKKLTLNTSLMSGRKNYISPVLE